MADRTFSSALLELIGLFLVLAGTWILAIVGIPDLLYPVLMGADGHMLTGAMGRPLLGNPNPQQLAAHSRYMWAAIPGMALITAGTFAQAGSALRTIYLKLRR